MSQAIQTKYIGPTNRRGSRVKAWANAGSLFLEWDDGLNSDQNHMAAAKALAAKLGWKERFYGGTLADCRVWLCVDESESFEVS